MTISLPTFEDQLRQRLLDVIYAQWHELGIAFAPTQNFSNEVIDPEALLWCSLEFVFAEPRLLEAIVSWFGAFKPQIIRQRINRRARDPARRADPRNNIWHVLNNAKLPDLEVPLNPGAGLQTGEQAISFYKKLTEDIAALKKSEKIAGQPERRCSTSLLQARNLLGSDLRHFIIVYLLANPSGGKLKTLQQWTGYSYRSVFETASRLQDGGALIIDHGYCHLADQDPWQALLPYDFNKSVIVDWFALFDSCVDLLRVLDKAKRRGLEIDSAVVQSYCQQTDRDLSLTVLGKRAQDSKVIQNLQEYIKLPYSSTHPTD